MSTVALRVTFTDALCAYNLYHIFPPQTLEYVEGWRRKRDGDSQVILLKLRDRHDLQRFYDLCTSIPEICEVKRIAAKEFWRAQSNAV